ncbi:hypothetical protein [Tissierella sp.]|uniref:hypothetical protein n=1 Tax=Tissierella sp. TaxID=41274 RepID=UPI0028578838|nr:hypothetical protein [Tissierella sp.]MDR7855374.1 hypothetical protein [Tissierella sp.]
MKRNGIYILIGALVLSQFSLLLRINRLESQTEYTKNQINNLSNDLRNDMNAIYSNVDDMLNRKESLIEISTTEIGTVNRDNLTVPITFTLTPKEVSENTMVSLDFNGELLPMNKAGTSFTTTVDRSIFSDALPNIVIDEKGVKKTMDGKQIGIIDIKNEIFPNMFPRLLGQASYSGGTYSRSGNLSVDTKESSKDIKFTKIRLVIKLDDKTISEEDIPNEVFDSGYEINKKIPLGDGEVCTMIVIATDNIGLEHHYTVDTWIGGSKMQREPWFEDEYIYSSDGKLLWEPEYTKSY